MFEFATESISVLRFLSQQLSCDDYGITPDGHATMIVCERLASGVYMWWRLQQLDGWAWWKLSRWNETCVKEHKDVSFDGSKRGSYFKNQSIQQLLQNWNERPALSINNMRARLRFASGVGQRERECESDKDETQRERKRQSQTELQWQLARCDQSISGLNGGCKKETA